MEKPKNYRREWMNTGNKDLEDLSVDEIESFLIEFSEEKKVDIPGILARFLAIAIHALTRREK